MHLLTVLKAGTVPDGKVLNKYLPKEVGIMAPSGGSFREPEFGVFRKLIFTVLLLGTIWIFAMLLLLKSSFKK